MQHSIAICGSMFFIDAMEELSVRLETLGYNVVVPKREGEAICWEGSDLRKLGKLKQQFIDGHLEKIRGSDAVLIANFEKRGISGYVGPNALMEAAFGYALDMPVVLLFEPADQPCSLELLGITSLVLGGDIGKLGALWVDA